MSHDRSRCDEPGYRSACDDDENANQQQCDARAVLGDDHVDSVFALIALRYEVNGSFPEDETTT